MWIRHVAPGSQVLETLRKDEKLTEQWWEDAESRHEDGISYLMVFAPDYAGAVQPAAWAGYRIEDEGGQAVLRCCNNYVRRTFRNRSPELYEVAYRARHYQVVTRFGLPAVTYLFSQPIELHEAHGWVKDTGPGSSGVSRAHPDGEDHYWWRLRWNPPRETRLT